MTADIKCSVLAKVMSLDKSSFLHPQSPWNTGFILHQRLEQCWPGILSLGDHGSIVRHKLEHTSAFSEQDICSIQDIDSIKNTKIPPELASSFCKTLFLLFHPLPNCCNLWHLNEILDTVSSGGNLWENSCGSDSFKDTRRVPLDRIIKGDLLFCKPHLIRCSPHFLNSRLHRELALAKAIAHSAMSIVIAMAACKKHRSHQIW